ncbi:MAG: hypothetical protein WCJ30_23070, partial [Deltaproteobacteria bacterium]
TAAGAAPAETHGPARPRVMEPRNEPRRDEADVASKEIAGRAEAMIKHADRAALHRGARGEIDVPGLGRVAIEARSHGGDVDVTIRTSHAESRAVLVEHRDRVVDDLRGAVPVHAVDIEGFAGSPRGERESSARDLDRGTDRGTDGTATRDGAVASRRPASARVRIVL